jgi:DNA mismatch repair protein MutS
MSNNIDLKNVTPMVRQYLNIKEDHKDAILFFRMGDFYEMFFEDAVLASKLLGITLTSRNKNKGDEIPLCGIPYHAAPSYISKLITKGHKVAICEQTEDPKLAKGIVKRDVIKVVTPGLVMDDANLDSKSNNFIMSLVEDNGSFAFSYADISTGDVYVSQVDIVQNLISEIFKVEPKEIITTRALKDTFFPKDDINMSNGMLINSVDDDAIEYFNFENLTRFFDENDLYELNKKKFSVSPKALGVLLDYVEKTQKSWAPQINRLISYHVTDFMIIDESTRRNLELMHTMRDMKKEGSLFGVLDATKTSMGARLLKKWINYPLIDTDKINERLPAVAELKDSIRIRKELSEALKDVYDIERLNSKLAAASGNARDLIALKNSIMKLPEIAAALAEVESPLLKELSKKLDLLEDVASLIHNSIVESPPHTVKEGGIIKSGHNKELDELTDISRHGKKFIASLEAKEKERTGINSLKIKFNKVFGYYIEITRTHLDKAPEDYIRKQTLVNAERFITQELKEYEDKVLSAEDKIVGLEYMLFKNIRDEVAKQNVRIKNLASVLANLDALLSFARKAAENNYTMPEVTKSGEINIIDGRHPVIEQINKRERFVPNDTYLDCAENRFAIITGPNMAGKSTYMRQVALIVLMAQMGSFVPAREAKIGVVDRIFTRVGASDNLAMGESTFMVEMKETAHILRNATKKSLIILDEIGRGTSTFDGLSIAWAVAEYILDKKKIGAKTLFATHYHELCDLKETKRDVKNYNIAIKEYNDTIVFLRKIVKGSTNRSYGIQVAKLAGLPKELTQRAHEILQNIEKGEFNEVGLPKIAISKKVAPDYDHSQLSLFHKDKSEIEEEIKQIDMDVITPIEALNKLYTLKKKIEDK